MIMKPRQTLCKVVSFDVDVVQYTWHPIVEADKLVGVVFLNTNSFVIVLPSESAKYKQTF